MHASKCLVITCLETGKLALPVRAELLACLLLITALTDQVAKAQLAPKSNLLFQSSHRSLLFLSLFVLL